MTKEEIITQLEDLKDNSNSFKDDLEPGSVWHKDIWALDYAIAVLKKEPDAPQQNRPLEK